MRDEIMFGIIVVFSNYLLKFVELKLWGEIKDEDKRVCWIFIF